MYNVTVKKNNKYGEAIFTVQQDFHEILRDNFSAICKAIVVRGRVLKELATKSDEDLEQFMQLIKNSKCHSLDELIVQIHDQIGLSKETTQYLFNLAVKDWGDYAIIKSVKVLLEEYKKEVSAMYKIIK